MKLQVEVAESGGVVFLQRLPGLLKDCLELTDDGLVGAFRGVADGEQFKCLPDRIGLFDIFRDYRPHKIAAVRETGHKTFALEPGECLVDRGSRKPESISERADYQFGTWCQDARA